MANNLILDWCNVLTNLDHLDRCEENLEEKEGGQGKWGSEGALSTLA